MRKHIKMTKKHKRHLNNTAKHTRALNLITNLPRGGFRL